MGFLTGVSTGDVLDGLLCLGRLLSLDISAGGRRLLVPLGLWSFSGCAERLEQQSD